MTFGERITTLRKRRELSQADLGKAVGTSGDLIGKYERDEVKPSIEVAIKISDALEVSLDFLVGKTAFELDKKMIKRLQDIQKLNEADREHILLTLDALLRDAQARKAYGK
jgi:transcriptional regulator with XRE-family HTH domain